MSVLLQKINYFLNIILKKKKTATELFLVSVENIQSEKTLDPMRTPRLILEVSLMKSVAVRTFQVETIYYGTKLP